MSSWEIAPSGGKNAQGTSLARFMCARLSGDEQKLPPCFAPSPATRERDSVRSAHVGPWPTHHEPLGACMTEG